ncbi:MAG TPA: FtsL-like putative cell division protein [Bacteroidia bacterium]|nr:FtsL-like putative cell division protein [Bacteroidia bacterium]
MAEQEVLHNQEPLKETPIDGASTKAAPQKKQVHKVVVRSVVDVINGNFLTNQTSLKQVPFVLFLTIVALFYIANSYYAERKIRQISKINNELKELRSEYITSKSKLMFVSKQSEVAKTAEDMGLPIKESTTPPGKIIVE